MRFYETWDFIKILGAPWDLYKIWVHFIVCRRAHTHALCTCTKQADPHIHTHTRSCLALQNLVFPKRLNYGIPLGGPDTGSLFLIMCQSVWSARSTLHCSHRTKWTDSIWKCPFEKGNILAELAPWPATFPCIGEGRRHNFSMLIFSWPKIPQDP